MNKTVLVGRLTADPELRQTQSGVASCRFTVAVNRRYADKSTGERQADFITCVAWRQTAEFVSRYFSKGKMIAVEGELRNNNYQDRNHPDVTHYCTEVLVDNVEFCGGKNDSGGNGIHQNNYNNSYSAPPQQAAPQQPNDITYGELSDFEEILSDGDVPF
ncbi:single-stranded DNA-binding protein [Ruminococcus sp.]|uniref:single-stranded DNA-binding protein n=1 Tax=Ruminococcus sp. TaxID=41978 RepID=UPI0025D851C2|nr:single-stranded DNA-binding protein [Ruminococcus sp.]MBQ6250198.1 single-stranded DNA-binding protein [Ruminococcus sp.]